MKCGPCSLGLWRALEGPSLPAEGWANLTTRVFYSKLLLHRSVNRHSMYRLKFREWEIHI